MKTHILKNLEETEKFGQKIGQTSNKGDIICITGNLGAGKTTLTKAIALGMQISEDITSPTFTIVHEHHSGKIPLYHFDVYRLNHSEDMHEIGCDEYFYGDGVCIVEWADLVKDIIPEHAKWLNIEYGNSEDERIIKCTF